MPDRDRRDGRKIAKKSGLAGIQIAVRGGAGADGAIRPVTAAYLRKAALHYIGQRSASLAMVRETLERRARRRLGVPVLETATQRLIDNVLDELVSSGLLDDARFASNRATTLAAKGLSRARIAIALRAKGIAHSAAADAIDHDLDDLAQARRFVVRKRLGGLRRGGMTSESRRKDLAALARAGFAFSVASKALDGADDD